jgi:hypothetical protein
VGRYRSPGDRFASRERDGELRELGRRGGRATRGRAVHGRVELNGDRFVRAVGGECEVARALLDVIRRRGELSVHVPPPPWRGALVAARRQQGVREAHDLPVELDHVRVERVHERPSARLAGRDSAERRPGEGSCCEQHVGGVLGELSHACVERIAQAPRHAQVARAGELQRVQRIAARELVHPGKLRSRQLDLEPVRE